MSSAAATACTRTSRCRLRRTAASLNSALYSWTFFGPARGTRHLPLLGGSVYKSEAGSPASFKRLLGSDPPLGAGKTVTCEEVLPSPQHTFDQREHIVSRAVGQMHPDFLFTDSVAPSTEATDTPSARRRDPGSRRLACCELEMLRCSRQVPAKCEPRIVIEGVNFAADLSCGGNSWIVLDPVDKGVSGDDKVEQAIRGYLILQ